jgi:hypothetical protein
MSEKPCKEYDNRTGIYQCTICGHQWLANHAIESIIDYCLVCKMRREESDDTDTLCESEDDEETSAVDDFFSHCGVEL